MLIKVAPGTITLRASYKLKADTTGSSLITVSYLGASSSFTLNVTA